MQKAILSLTIFFLYFTSVFAQNIDTIYYDKNFNQTGLKKHKYIGLVQESGDRFKVTVTKKGKIISTGYYKTNEYKERTGPFYYNKDDRIYKLELYEANKYPEIQSKYEGPISLNAPQVDSLNLMVGFYKNGKVSFIGYFSNCCYYYGTWYSFYNDGSPAVQSNYSNKMLNGPYIIYAGKQVWISGQYKDGKKDGEWVKYDFNGNLRKTEYYQYGKVIKRIR